MKGFDHTALILSALTHPHPGSTLPRVVTDHRGRHATGEDHHLTTCVHRDRRAACDCGSFLQTVHNARMVHADLKPANFVMVEGQLKIIDFGITKACNSDTTAIQRETPTGTVQYMSPESVRQGAPSA